MFQRLIKLEDSTMEYRKPEIVVQTNSLEAVQSNHVKVSPTSDGAGSTLIATTNAYEADE